ncbi:Transcription factor atf21 [Madurella mycetomatis]|uniref:Transcription factor atf21 n=1 Tax=Madurella mycetomatis TaxID=100816 RepID=A0A175W7B8_9PEZI|nr:Transcription factor atf21 [Madurella mycetomatis]
MARTGRWQASVQVDASARGDSFDYCELIRTSDKMGNRATDRNSSTLERQETGVGIDGFASMLDARRPRPQDATAPLPHWGTNGNHESLLSFGQTTASMDWPDQTSPTGSDHLRQMVPTHSDLAGEQYFQSSTEWLQLPSAEYASAVIDGFETGLSDPSSIPWPLAALAPSINGPSIMSGSMLHSESISSDPVGPLEIDPKLRALSMTPRPADNATRLQQCQDTPTGGCDLEYRRRKREGLPHTGAADGSILPRRKRGRPPNQTGDVNLLMQPRSPIPRRESTAGTTTSSDATAVADADSLLLYNVDNAALSPHETLPKSTTTTKPLPPPTTITHAGRGSASSTNNKGNNKSDRSRDRDRNRAAASRYRAKTQAAFAQLEAEEREVSERRQALLASVSRLRDEVFQLKNELLRHADCGCPLIQGYLSHAARQASAELGALGFVEGERGNGPGG